MKTETTKCLSAALLLSAPLLLLAAEDPPGVAPAAAAPASTPDATRPAGKLNYRALMKRPPAERLELIKNWPEEDRDAFLATLPGDHKAVLLVDPADCGQPARLLRATFANADPKGGVVSETAKDVGSSVGKGLLNFVLPGLGDTVGTAAQINEAARFVRYEDVCDMPPDRRTALLAAEEEPPKKEERSLFEQASRFFSR